MDSGTEKDQGHAAALSALQSILVPGETVEAVAVQRRIFALLHRRSLVAATTGRVIGMTRGLFGGFQPSDLRWQDLRDAKLDVGIVGASLTLHSTTSAVPLVFHGLDKEQAQDVYRRCQSQEQAWVEKRRIRELEELRARAGGVQIGQTPSGADPRPAPVEDSLMRLERAKTMLDKGLITDSEYESIKAKVINSL